MSYECIEYSVNDAVAEVRLNRPAIGNALSLALLQEMNSAFQAAESDPSVRVVLLSASGKNFCVGADLQDAAALEKPVDQHLLEDHLPNLLAIRCSQKTYIAVTQGALAGIGGAYALLSDVTIMADNAYLYQAFLPIGLVPDGGITWLLGRHLGYKRAFKLISEATKLDAATCLDWGLASDVVPLEELTRAAGAKARQLASVAPLALSASKQLLNRVFEEDFPAAVAAEAEQQLKMLKSEDAAEGVAAFLEKRRPVFKGR